jgi:hypothetical protein
MFKNKAKWSRRWGQGNEFWRHLQGTGTRTEVPPCSLQTWDGESCSARSGSLGAGLPWGGAPLDADFGVVTHFSRPRGWQGSLRSSTEFVPENQRGLSMPLMRPPSPNLPVLTVRLHHSGLSHLQRLDFRFWGRKFSCGALPPGLPRGSAQRFRWDSGPAQHISARLFVGRRALVMDPLYCAVCS